MTPLTEPVPQDYAERHCTAHDCGRSPSFRVRLVPRGDPPCECGTWSADACAAHLVDVIHYVAEWARRECPHPVDVTVYVPDAIPAPDIHSAPSHDFTFTTLHVPD